MLRNTNRRACRQSREDGSVLIEFMAVLPFFAGVWLLALYVFDFHQTSVRNQREVRSCAWHFASSGCTNFPSHCRPADKEAVRDSELRTATSGGLDVITGFLPFLEQSLTALHGDSFRMEASQLVNRPKEFGGAVQVNGHYQMMCNPSSGPWITPHVFSLTCATLGTFCP